MTKKELLDLIKQNKNTEHVSLPIPGRCADGYDYDEIFCVVYINDSDYQHADCTGNIRIASSNCGEKLDWILLPIEEMKKMMRRKMFKYVWEKEFYFEFEEGNMDGADSIPLKVLKVDKDFITLIEDKDFDEDQFYE